MSANLAGHPATQPVNSTETLRPFVGAYTSLYDIETGSGVKGTKANVASSTSSVTLLAANASRRQAIIYNDSTAVLYLDLTGGTASSTSYSVQIASQSSYTTTNIGTLTGAWASVNGNARITELT